MKQNLYWLKIICGVVVLTAGIHQSMGQACGNCNSGGVASKNGPKGGEPIVINTGNEYRDIEDLSISGSVGQAPMVWKRWSNSRTPGGTSWFGNGHSWRHGYQWEMVSSGTTTSGAPQLKVLYPEGTSYTFAKGSTATTGPEQAGASPILWQPVSGTNILGVGELLYQNGTDFYLQRANGFVYHFTQNTTTKGTVYYLMTDFYDSQNNQYLFTYNAGLQLTRVTEPGGRYFQITYSTLSLSNCNSTTLATVSSIPSANQWTTLPVTNTHAYRYLRYLSPDSSYGDIAEIQFYDTKGNLLTGAPFGSGPAAALGTDYAQAVDGNTGTYFDSAVPTGNYVGIDLGVGKSAVIGSIKFFPRLGYESRMYIQPGLFGATTGVFQGSNEASASITVISKITSSDGRTVAYNYQPFNDSTLPTMFQVLASVTYEDGTQATYTSQQIEPGTRPLITAYVDPRYKAPLSKSRAQYYTGTTGNFGQVKHQLSYDTQDVLQTIGIGSGGLHNPTDTYGNGAVESYSMVNGLATAWVDGLGRKTTYVYSNNGWGYRISKTDPLGRKTLTVPSILGNPLFITYPDGTTEGWTRDNKDLALSHTDQSGRVTTYIRDNQHRITQVTYSDSSTESFTYNNFSEVLTHTLRNGGTESFVYSTSGLLTNKTDAAGNVWSYGYDSFGRLASLTDPKNNSEQYVYSSRGLLTQVIHADGSTKNFTYDLFGNVISETNELGNVSTYAYDQFNRLVSITDSLNRVSTFGFVSNDPFNHPISSTLPSGKTTSNTYDLEWNRLSSTASSGTVDAAKSSFVYDKGNRITQITDPKGGVSTLTYDLLNRKLTATDPLSRMTKWSYDQLGNVLTTTRPNNGVTVNTYDVMNHLVSSTDPKNETTQYAYDFAGRLASITDAKGNVSGFQYDSLNRKVALVFPDGSQQQWFYDPAGNVSQYTTRAGQTKVSVYDNRNREIGYSWSDSTPAVSRTYDVLGRLLTLNNGVSNLSYSYDQANQLLSETQAIVGLNNPQVIGYGYDLDGNRQSLIEPDGTVTSYSFTNRNQISTISQNATVLASYTYDLDGNRISRGLGNGTQTNYQWDKDNELTSLSIDNAASTVLGSFSYAYDNVGRRTSVTHEDGKGDAYSYDAVDQIQNVAYGASNPQIGATGANRTVSYQFDAVGNRTNVVDSQNGTTNYQTNNLNQYTQTNLTASSGSTSSPFWYDGNGNLTFGMASGSKYDYDAQNRLVSAAVNGNVILFNYDAKNRCVSRTVNGTTSYLIYDGWNLLEEWNGQGVELNRYVHGVGMDEMVSKTDSNNQTVYYHQDGLGSTASLTDTTGKILEKYTFDVFGKATITDGNGQALTVSAFGNRFLFAGREFLAEVNLYDYRNRVYSADIGRFLQTDPILFDAGDVNIYRYVGNNPINLTDPNGENLGVVIITIIIIVAIIAEAVHQVMPGPDPEENPDPNQHTPGRESEGEPDPIETGSTAGNDCALA